MAEYSLQGKKVLVTGASSGIGAALAEGFARRGATVGICARRAERLDAVLERLREHQPACCSWTIDLADLAGIDEFAAQAVSQLGGIDVLVNNAGIPKRKAVGDLDGDTVDAVMRINYSSPVRLSLALLSHIVDRGGRLVFVSSVAARLSPPHEAAYAASKAALSAFAECTHVDLAATDAGVCVVYPGVIDTELFALPDNEAPLADLDPVPVQDVVDPVLDAIEHGELEVAVPSWFSDMWSAKFADVGAFLDGTIEWARGRGAYDRR